MFGKKLAAVFFILSVHCMMGYGQVIWLYLPHDGAITGDRDMSFEWRRKSPTATYTLALSTDSLFSNPLLLSTNVPKANIGNLLYGQTYWWRVIGSGGDTSVIRKFEVMDIKAAGPLSLWLRADSAVTLNGSDLVSGWTDLSDSMRSASQLSPFIMPSWVSTSFNNLPAVRFGKNGGSGQQTTLTIPPLALNTPICVFSVHRVLSNNNLVQYLMANTLAGIFLGGTVSGVTNSGIYNDPSVFAATGTMFQNLNLTTWRKNQIRRNGSNLSTTGSIGNLSVNTLGGRPEIATLFFHGLLPELLVYKSALPDSTRDKVERYLVSKYARPVRLPADTLVCGPSLSLTLPGGTEEFSSILWSTGATGTSINITQNGTYWVRGASRLGGYITTDTIRVTGIHSIPVTSITTPQRFICYGDTLTNVYLNANPNQPWYWSNGFTGNTLVITQPGTYQVFQPHPSGCILSSPPLQVINRVNADFVLPNGCEGDTLMFTDLSQDALNDPIVFFNWQFGPNAIPDTTHRDTVFTVFNQPGSYPIQLIAYNSLGCPDTTERMLVVSPKPAPQFSINNECVGNPVTFTNLTAIPTGTSLSQVRWNLGNGVVSNQIGPTTSYAQSGTYPVQLRVKFSNGCIDSLEQAVQINKDVSPIFSLPKDTFCFGELIYTADQSLYSNTNPGTIQWRINGAIEASGINFSKPAAPVGNNVLRMTLQSSNGCVAETSRHFFVQALPTAQIASSTQLAFPPANLQFINNSLGEFDQVRWVDPFGITVLNQDTCFTTLSDTGLYQVFLHVQDRFGCMDSTSLPIRIVLPQMNTKLFNLQCTVNNGYVSANFSIRNESFQLPIQEMELALFVDQSSRFTEEWKGQLAPGSLLEYVYNAQVETIGNPNVCCVQIQRIRSEYNPGQFLEQAGGTYCEAMTNEFMLVRPFPNPTSGPVSVFVVLPDSGEATWSLSASSGTTAMAGNWSGQAGVHELNLDLSALSVGLYFLEVRFKNQTVHTKILVHR